ncbi:fatty acid desaturase [Neotabrizicola sp. VNH66]|uniref:fatty acid desaturase n=1 Tax=Neotabrizicola sp. VNH66 TaxID=3400918 RepID=UPI003C0E126D
MLTLLHLHDDEAEVIPPHTDRLPLEWPTLLLLGVTYGLWGLGTTALWQIWPPLGLLAVTLAVAQHSSLQHEALHGHPFRNPHLNHALVFPAIGLFYPYLRFVDTHLAHHHDPVLTDPYDDPESNYMDPAVWARLPRAARLALRANNTLLGRMVLGPLIGGLCFYAGDLQKVLRGDRRVQQAWVLHLLGLAPVLWWLLSVAQMPLWGWALSAYLGLSLLKIRTFLEHRAHELHRARSVVIEDKGPLALLFLNNNLHAVHHMHPAVPWYRLPAMYRARRDHYLRRNEAYVYPGYGAVFRRHFLRAKDPVPHPVWSAPRD